MAGEWWGIRPPVLGETRSCLWFPHLTFKLLAWTSRRAAERCATPHVGHYSQPERAPPGRLGCELDRGGSACSRLKPSECLARRAHCTPQSSCDALEEEHPRGTKVAFQLARVLGMASVEAGSDATSSMAVPMDVRAGELVSAHSMATSDSLRDQPQGIPLQVASDKPSSDGRIRSGMPHGEAMPYRASGSGPDIWTFATPKHTIVAPSSLNQPRFRSAEATSGPVSFLGASSPDVGHAGAISTQIADRAAT